MGHKLPEKAKAVLHFWFEELKPSDHFRSDPELDETIRTRFGALHEELSRGVPPEWLSSAQARLAAIIVLDQWSRNLFRGDGRAFAQDAAALHLANQSIVSGDLDRLPVDRASFVVMPLMHAENVADVSRSVRLLSAMGNHGSARFGRLHLNSIIRFGRYPARNEALGRRSTREELRFLAEHPAGF